MPVYPSTALAATACRRKRSIEVSGPGRHQSLPAVPGFEGMRFMYCVLTANMKGILYCKRKLVLLLRQRFINGLQVLLSMCIWYQPIPHCPLQTLPPAISAPLPSQILVAVDTYAQKAGLRVLTHLYTDHRIVSR